MPSTARRFSLVWLACFTLLALRRPDALLAAQFFAEDGSEWFTDAFHGKGGLLDPYAGYAHLIPRLVARLSDAFLPIRWHPLAYNLVALALASFACAYFSRPCFRHVVRDARLRITVCVALAAWPGAYEIIGTITNAQWWLACWAMLVCIQRWPDSRLGQAGLGAAWLAVLASAPNLLALAPLLALRAVLDRSARGACATLAVAAITYGFFLHVSHAGPRASPQLLLEASALFEALGLRVAGVCLLGADELEDMHAGSTAALLLGALLFAAWAAGLWLRRRERRFVLVSSALGACAVAALTLFVHVRVLGDPALAEVWRERLHHVGWGSRFGVLPGAALYVTSAAFLEGSARVSGAWSRVGAFVLVFGFACVDNFRHVVQMKALDWPTAAAAYEAARARGAPVAFDAQINPDHGPESPRWSAHTSLLAFLAKELGVAADRELRARTPLALSFEMPRYWRTLHLRVRADGGAPTVRVQIRERIPGRAPHVHIDRSLTPTRRELELALELLPRNTNSRRLELEITSESPTKVTLGTHER